MVNILSRVLQSNSGNISDKFLFMFSHFFERPQDFDI